jgi:hypothetical protein
MTYDHNDARRDSKRALAGYKQRKMARLNKRIRVRQIPRSIMMALTIAPIATAAFA